VEIGFNRGFPGKFAAPATPALPVKDPESAPIRKLALMGLALYKGYGK